MDSAPLSETFRERALGLFATARAASIAASLARRASFSAARLGRTAMGKSPLGWSAVGQDRRADNATMRRSGPKGKSRNVTIALWCGKGQLPQCSKAHRDPPPPTFAQHLRTS